MPRNDFESFSILNLLRSPFRKLAELASDDGRIRADRSPGEVVVGVITFPFRFVYAVLVFLVQAWTTSRNGFAFIRGIPALAIFAAAAAIVWAGWVSDWFGRKLVAQASRNYRLHATKDPDNPEYAEMFAEKLVEMRPHEERWKYQLALAREQAGNLDSAKLIMNSLAPVEDQNGNGELDEGEDLNGDGEISPGNVDAQVWLGNYYLTSAETESLPEEERFAKARLHYDLALAADPENLMALLRTSEILRRQDDVVGAMEYLDRLARAQPDRMTLIQVSAIPELIRLHKEQGQENQALGRMKSAVLRLKPIARRFADNFEIWRVLVRSAMLVDDYTEAEELIKLGLQFAKNEETRQKLVKLSSDVYTAKADQYENLDDQEQYRNRLFQLCEAVKTNPFSSPVYERLIEYAVPANDPENKAIWLRDAILGCPNPAVIHVILGMQEIADGNFLQGQKHWRIADQQSQIAQLAVNQLIAVSFRGDTEFFENTGDMITVAIEMFPEQFLLYHTQGRFLCRKGEFEAAVEPLRHAVSNMASFIPARIELVDALRELGREEEAKAAEREMEQVISGLNENQRREIRLYLKQKEAGRL